MSESGTKKSETKEENGSEEKPDFALTTPTDIGSSFSFGPSAQSSEVKPFVFGSSVAENKVALSQAAPISALVEQRAKMASARRNKQTGGTIATEASSKPTAAAAAAAPKSSFSFRTDSSATPFAVNHVAPDPKTPFVFESDEKEAAEATERARMLASITASARSDTTGATFSSGSTGGIIPPRSTINPRQRRDAGRGRGRRKNSNASDSSPAAASFNDLKPAATATTAHLESKQKDDCQCDDCRTRRAGGNRATGDLVPEPEPKGTFARAPTAELRRRKVLRVSKNNTSMHQASAAATVKSASENRKPEPENTARFASTTVNNNGGSNDVANGTGSRAVADRANSDTNDGDDDSMPALESAGLTGKEESSNEQKKPDVNDDVRESEDDSERERIEFIAQRIASDVFSRLMEDMEEEESEEDSEEKSDEEDSEDEESDDNDSDDGCMCDECVSMRRSNQRAAASYAAESAENDDGSDDDQCCICFCEPTSSNRIALLPCCGSATGEDTSTVKFCNKCIVKCLKSQGPDASSSIFEFILEDEFIGECPRCRKLISVSKREAGMTARPDIVKQASFRQAVRLSLRDREKGMRPILYTACCVYPHYMPVELFEDEVDKAQQLVRYGILQEVNKKKLVYAMNPEKQELLYDIALARFEENSDDEDDDSNNPFSPQTVIILRACVQLFLASFYAICKFKIVASCRMFNQGIGMFMQGVGALPRGLHRQWQGIIVSCLNILLLSMLFQLVFLLLAYIVSGYGTVKVVGWWLSTPGFKSLVRRVFYTGVIATLVVGVYRANKYDLIMYSSVLFGMFAGGCHLSSMSISAALRKLWKKLS